MIRDKKYYIRKANGGYSPCILGNENHRDKELNVLPNCVGWATGRFNELAEVGSCKYLGNTNAKNFVNYASTQKLTLGQKPKVGACMIWGGVGNAGHVAIVEKVISDTEVVTSESGWTSKVSYFSKTRKKGIGYWGEVVTHPFKGFLYNPKNLEPKNDFLPKRGYFKKGDTSKNIGLIATFMRRMFPTYTSEKALGNYFGVNLEASIKEFQRRTGLESDGCIGKLTLAQLEKYGFKY